MSEEVKVNDKAVERLKKWIILMENQNTFELGIILFREQNRENLNDFRDQRISPGCAKWNNLFMTQFTASRSVERVSCELNMIA